MINSHRTIGSTAKYNDLLRMDPIYGNCGRIPLLSGSSSLCVCSAPSGSSSQIILRGRITTTSVSSVSCPRTVSTGVVREPVRHLRQQALLQHSTSLTSTRGQGTPVAPLVPSDWIRERYQEIISKAQLFPMVKRNPLTESIKFESI